MGTFTVQDRSGHDCLTVGQPSIAGADLAMPEDLESLLFEAGSQQPRQPPIVQASPGERYLIDPRDIACMLGNSNERLGDAGIEKPKGHEPRCWRQRGAKISGNDQTITPDTEITRAAKGRCTQCAALSILQPHEAAPWSWTLPRFQVLDFRKFGGSLTPRAVSAKLTEPVLHRGRRKMSFPFLAASSRTA